METNRSNSNLHSKKRGLFKALWGELMQTESLIFHQILEEKLEQ